MTLQVVPSIGPGPKRARKEAAWRDQLMLTNSNRPRANLANTILVLRNTGWSERFAWDAFSLSVTWEENPPWDVTERPSEYTEEFSDTDASRLCAWLARNMDLDVAPETIWRAVSVVAESHQVHPVRDYLGSLAWDGVPRVERWMATYLGADDSPYVRRVGPLVLRSAVARVLRPGCKVDTMAVLEGPQGSRKSTALRTLFGGRWLSDTPPDLASKDRFSGLRGKWAVEIAELDSFDRAEANRIKSYLSSPVDDYRPPYGRTNVRAPRQCIFVGTTNGDTYLRDATGNRRFWPIKVSKIDIDAIARDRDQLWAEALADVNADRPWWPESGDAPMFAAEQAARVVGDTWEDDIASYVAGREFVTVGEVLSKSLGLHDKDKQTQAAQNRVAAVLVKAGRERRQRRIDGRPTWGYVTTVTSPGEADR